MHQALQGLGRHAQALATEELRVAAHEVLRQHRDLFRPLPEGRDHDLDDIQAVVEIFPEATCRHRLLEILVGRSQHPHVDLHGGAAADPGELTVLEHVEQLALERGVQVPDLIEKDGSAIRGLELADLELVGAGEGPALMAEQLALEELARHRGTVDLDEGARLAHRRVVDRPGDDVLSGTRLAADEHGDVDAGGLLDDLPHLGHPSAPPETDLLAQPVPRLVVVRPVPVAAGAGQRALDHSLEIVGSERLLQEVVRAERGGLSHALDRVRSRDHDRRARRATLILQPAEQVIVFVVEVKEAHQELAPPELGQRVVRSAYADRLVAPLGQRRG